MQNFILIGYGNLAHSMMSGFSQDSKFKNQTFYIYGRDLNKAENFAKCFVNAATIPSLEAITPQTNIILYQTQRIKKSSPQSSFWPTLLCDGRS